MVQVYGLGFTLQGLGCAVSGGRLQGSGLVLTHTTVVLKGSLLRLPCEGVSKLIQGFGRYLNPKPKRNLLPKS